jgi:CheY-like chemotaxis protein
MQNINHKPRILFVDNDEDVQELYKFLLEDWGYEPVIATGEGNSLIRDAIIKARNLQCVLALIDMRLYDNFEDDDVGGLKLASKIGPIPTIILTGYQNEKILREMLENHKDIPFLSKTDAPEKRKHILDIETRKVCASMRALRITPADLPEKVGRKTFGNFYTEYPDQVADTLAKLFPSASNLKLEKLDSSLSYFQMSTVPRPQSIVFRAYEEDYEPVVVKLARAEKIKEEVDRYEKFIARKVGGNFIAKLERHALLWDIGGALYSYIGDFDVKTFSRYYEEHPVEDIQICLTSFFTVSWGKHYERRHALRNVSLFDLYGKVWGNWYEKRVKNFTPTTPLQDVEIYRRLELPEPIDWFKRNIAGNRAKDLSIVKSTYECITHGDLHGDNLLIDSQKNAWVIDFERSGDGHALQDFIELESDIINRLEAHKEDFKNYLKMSLLIAQQTQIKPLDKSEIDAMDPSFQKALGTISVLRSLAQKCTTLTDARQYLLGLLFNMIFRATINHSEKKRMRQTRALLLASIFCHRLDHWEEPWPPAEWKSILQE